MKPTNKLNEILAVNLCWDKRRIACFVKMLIAIMAVQTVNLTRLANYIGEKSKIASRYRRLQRFFQYCEINYNTIAVFIIKLLTTRQFFN